MLYSLIWKLILMACRKHFVWLSISALKRRLVPTTLPYSSQKQRRSIKCEMGRLQVIKQGIRLKTLNEFTSVLVICWIVVGTILYEAFVELEINASRFDFRCAVTGDIDTDFIRGNSYHRCEIQNHRVGIPPYAFILVNVSPSPVMTVICSQCVKSTADLQDAEGEARRRSHRLFFANLCQLLVSMALAITSIV